MARVDSIKETGVQSQHPILLWKELAVQEYSIRQD